MRACNCARASPFQSRTREGGDPQLSIRQTMRISFNPRTRVGCDSSHLSQRRRVGMFQSTHPRGVRRRTHAHGLGRYLVSIHAPAWGATSAISMTCVISGVFQSTHPRGVRPRRYGCTAARTPFQSTHPRGVRHPVGGVVLLYKPMFQSTHPRGVRQDGVQLFRCRRYVSIHAPAWGATWYCPQCRLERRKFQSTHPRGVRLFPCFIQ